MGRDENPNSNPGMKIRILIPDFRDRTDKTGMEPGSRPNPRFFLFPKWPFYGNPNLFKSNSLNLVNGGLRLYSSQIFAIRYKPGIIPGWPGTKGEFLSHPVFPKLIPVPSRIPEIPEISSRSRCHTGTGIPVSSHPIGDPWSIVDVRIEKLVHGPPVRLRKFQQKIVQPLFITFPARHS